MYDTAYKTRLGDKRSAPLYNVLGLVIDTV